MKQNGKVVAAMQLAAIVVYVCVCLVYEIDHKKLISFSFLTVHRGAKKVADV